MLINYKVPYLLANLNMRILLWRSFQWEIIMQLQLLHCKRDIFKFGSDFIVKQSFSRFLLKAWLSQYWNWISGDSEKELTEDISCAIKNNWEYTRRKKPGFEVINNMLWWWFKQTLEFRLYTPHTVQYYFERKLFNLNNYWSSHADELFFFKSLIFVSSFRGYCSFLRFLENVR